MKDQLNKLIKSNVFNSFHDLVANLPILKITERTPFERTKEHVTRADSTIKKHLNNCSNVNHLFSIYNVIFNGAIKHEFRLSLFRHNARIIDYLINCVLLFKRAYYIKEKCPILNISVKASRTCNSTDCLLTIMYMQFILTISF